MSTAKKTTPPTNSYDEVPYPEFCFRESHPDRLASIGTLFGMKCADISTAKVLELGGASGGNLIPMAVEMPEASFMGIDLSTAQIERAKKISSALNLKNTKFVAKNILDLDPKIGKFDYIICHGVYSWVPEVVQSQILSLCEKHLNPEGIAYISYNTLPGWNMHRTLRDLMLYHTAQFPEAGVKIGQARAMLKFMAESVPDSSPFGLLLRREQERLSALPDSYLFHDHLEENNRPVYFHEFASRAEKFNLMYLGEAQISQMWGSEFAPTTQNTLKGLSQGSLVRMEQYLDFIRNQTFRRSLLCKKEVKLNRKLSVESLSKLWVACGIRPQNRKVNPFEAGPEKFRATSGEELTLNDPVVKTTLCLLSNEWPGWVSFTELVGRVEKLFADSGKKIEKATATVGNVLLDLVRQNGVELHSSAPHFTRIPGEKPKVSPYAQFLIAQRRAPVSLRHENVNLNEMQQIIAMQLTGKNTIAQVAETIEGLLKEGKLQLKSDPKKEQKVTIEQITNTVKQAVMQLAGMGFLLPADGK